MERRKGRKKTNARYEIATKSVNSASMGNKCMHSYIQTQKLNSTTECTNGFDALHCNKHKTKQQQQTREKKSSSAYRLSFAFFVLYSCLCLKLPWLEFAPSYPLAFSLLSCSQLPIQVPLLSHSFSVLLLAPYPASDAVC